MALEDEATLNVTTKLTHSGTVDLHHGSTLNIGGDWAPEVGAKIKVTGNAKVQADTIDFSNGVTITFTADDNQQPEADKAMLTLEQTDQSAIGLNQVTLDVAFTPEAALQSKDIVLLESNTGFDGDPTMLSNSFYELKCDDSNGNRKCTAEVKADPPPETEDPDTEDPSTENPGTEEPSTPSTPGQGGQGSGSDDQESQPELSPEEQAQAQIDALTGRLGRMGANGQQQALFARMFSAYGVADNTYYDHWAQVWSYLQHASSAEVMTTLDALMPDYSALVLTHERALNEDVTDAVFNQHDAQPLSTNSALWLKASTVSAEDESANAFELDRNSVALGLSTMLTPSWDLRAGFALSDFDGNTSSRDLEGDAYRIFVGSTYQIPVGPGTLELGGVVQAGQSSYEESLGHPALGHYASDYDVTTVGAALRAGYTLATERGAISPELKLSYLHTDSDGLTAPLGQSVSDAQADLVTVQAGVDFKANLLTTANAQLTLTGGLHAAYDLAAEGLERTVTLADGSGYQLEGMEPDDFRLLPQLSLELSLYESLELEAGFRRSQGDDYSENQWQARAQYRF